MSARIYIHPRNPEGLLQVCARFRSLGYALSNTKRGHIEARPIPVLHNVVAMKPTRKS